MDPRDAFQRRQLMALSTVVLLAPALRLCPAGAAALAGRAAWLSALAALPPMLLYLLLLCRLMAQAREGEGLAELCLRLAGPLPGRLLLGLLAAWLLLYGAFVLRSGADRFVVTLFPRSSPAEPALIMGLLSLTGALGMGRSLLRVAKMVLPVLLAALGLILAFGLWQAEKSELLPLTVCDLAPAGLGALPVADLLTLGLYLPCFFGGARVGGGRRFRTWALWLCGMCLLLSLLSAAVLGAFGAALTLRLSQPFFTLVRNLVFFRTLERMEALTVALWLFPDLLLSSALLWSAGRCLRLILGFPPGEKREKRLSLGDGRWLIWLCGAAMTALGMLLAPDAARLQFWSRTLLPRLNALVSFGLIPLILLIGKLRRGA